MRQVSNGVNSTMNFLSEAAIALLGERQTEDLKVPGSIPGLRKVPRVFAAPKLVLPGYSSVEKPNLRDRLLTGSSWCYSHHLTPDASAPPKPTSNSPLRRCFLNIINSCQTHTDTGRISR